MARADDEGAVDGAVKLRVFFILVFTCAAAAGYAQRPIIDVHGHTLPGDWDNPEPESQVNREYIDKMADTLKRHNVVAFVASGAYELEMVYREKLGAVLVPSLGFPCRDSGLGTGPYHHAKCFESGLQWPAVDWVDNQLAQGRYRVLGELLGQYVGFGPGAQEYDPYFALAVKHDVPIAIHAGGASPRMASRYPRFRLRHGNPMDLEDALVKYPTLRVQIMHIGGPYFDDAIALLNQFPRVMIDVTPFQFVYPADAFHQFLQRVMRSVPNADKRIMFGTDHGPELYQQSINAFESAAFLSEAQKSRIFCHNAQEWLRLDESLCH